MFLGQLLADMCVSENVSAKLRKSSVRFTLMHPKDSRQAGHAFPRQCIMDGKFVEQRSVVLSIDTRFYIHVNSFLLILTNMEASLEFAAGRTIRYAVVVESDICGKGSGDRAGALRFIVGCLREVVCVALIRYTTQSTPDRCLG